VVLETDDPRGLLAALGADGASALPPPRTIEYGAPSLQDLYRELYGVEGV
jgi:hypothetical protein